MICANCAQLEERVDRLRHELGLMRSAEGEARLQSRYGISRQEARILRYMIGREDRVTTRDALMLDLYSDTLEEPEIRVLDVFVCRIRKRLPSGAIYSVRGQGWALTPDALATCKAVLQG